MRLLILFGPPSVGKMTVGKYIEEQTDYKLLHNHMVMDGVMHIFGKNTPAEDRLSRLFRENIIREAADANLDLIFTYVWNFSLEKGKHNIDAYKQLYESRGGRVDFVELTAPLATRIDRAANPNRFDAKTYTADADEVARLGETRNFVSPTPFFYPNQCIQIDTKSRNPEDIASQIIDWQHRSG
jgi:hypothetical protein